MNLLSGVTWKGAKLRIGEAKANFRERYVFEHEATDIAYKIFFAVSRKNMSHH